MTHVSPRQRFAARLERAIALSCLTEQEVAIKLGYSNGNVITMIKQGSTRLPLDKVVPIARALDLDPGQLLQEWFATYTPEALPHLQEYLGMLLSHRERSWVQGLRRHVGPVPTFDDRWAEGLKALVDDTEG